MRIDTDAARPADRAGAGDGSDRTLWLNERR